MVFGDDAIEESTVNTCSASLAQLDREVHVALERERERQTVEIEPIVSETSSAERSARPSGTRSPARRWRGIRAGGFTAAGPPST